MNTRAATVNRGEIVSIHVRRALYVALLVPCMLSTGNKIIEESVNNNARVVPTTTMPGSACDCYLRKISKMAEV